MYDEEECIVEWLDESTTSTTEPVTQFTQPSQTVTELMSDQSFITKTYAAKSVIPDRTSSYSNNILRPAPAMSPANSTSSEVSTCARSVRSLPKTAKKRKSNEDPYADTIQTIVDSLKQPIAVKSLDTTVNNHSSNTSDPVDACMAFVGSILKHIKNEVLKLDMMQVLVQTVINASTQDINTTNHT